jgi:hypothetical protein
LRGTFDLTSFKKIFFARYGLKIPPQSPAIPRKLRGGGCTE